MTSRYRLVNCEQQINGAVELLAPTAAAVIDPDQRYVSNSNAWFATTDITSTLASPSCERNNIGVRPSYSSMRITQRILGSWVPGRVMGGIQRLRRSAQ